MDITIFIFNPQAKLIPPSIADLYKVITEEDDSKTSQINHKPKLAKSFSKKKKDKSKKHRKRSYSSSSSSSSSSSYSESSSSSNSSSEASENLDVKWNKKKAKKKKNKTFCNVSENGPKRNGKWVAISHSSPITKTPTIRTHPPKGDYDCMGTNEDSSFSNTISATDKDSATIDYGICNLCGLGYNARPKEFWFTLSHPMPSALDITVLNALQV